MADKSIKDLSNKLRPQTIKACKVTGQKNVIIINSLLNLTPFINSWSWTCGGRVIYMEYAYIFMSKLRKKD
jgi:hypothetical protein